MRALNGAACVRLPIHCLFKDVQCKHAVVGSGEGVDRQGILQHVGFVVGMVAKGVNKAMLDTWGFSDKQLKVQPTSFAWSRWGSQCSQILDIELKAESRRHIAHIADGRGALERPL